MFRCRSAFKLVEINEKYKILNRGHTVIDVGAAPGSWTQVAVREVQSGDSNDNKKGRVISIDRQYIYPIEVARNFSY